MPYKVYENAETKLRTYRNRVKAAEALFNKEKPDCLKALARYENEVTADQFSVDGHRVNVSTGVGVIDSIYSALTALQPDFTMSNVGHGSPDMARVAAQALQETWREAKVQKKSAYAVKDSPLVGLGVVKISYDYAEEEEEVERSEEDFQKDAQLIVAEANKQGIRPPSPDEIAAAVPVTEKVVKVRRDRVVADHIPWDEILYDPTAKKWEDVRWVCQVSKVPLYEVQDNQDFKDYLRNSKYKLTDITPDSQLDEELMLGREPDPEEDEMVTLYIFFDFETGTICTFTRQADFVLDERPNPLAFQDDIEDRNPFVPLILRFRPNKVRGLADMKVIMPSLDELNTYRSKLATYLARFVPKIIAKEGTFTEAGKNALRSQDPGEVVEIDQAHSTDDVEVMTPPQLMQEFFDMPGRIQLDIREATGLNELERGLFPDRKRTATETNAVMVASNNRQSEKRNALEDFYLNIARRILVYMQLFYEQPRISRMVDDMGDVIWEWTADDIAGEYDLEIALTPKEPKTQDAKRDDAMFLANYLATFPEVDRTTLGMLVLDLMGFRRDTTRTLFKNPEEMQQEQMAALQQAANEQAASQGIVPDAASVPGPMAGADLAMATNPGEVPAEMAP